MVTMKTPEVYIVEKSEFPNSVVEVATAVPAFIGYTEKAVNGNKSLLNKPWKITSMAEYQNYFGGAPSSKFTLTEGKPDDKDEKKKDKRVIRIGGKDYTLARTDAYTLFYHILLFFANGGGPCFIVSVGSYTDEFIGEALTEGITPLIKEQEPSMLVIPEAVKLASEECYTLQQAMLMHCGYTMRNRFAILDIYDGDHDRKDPLTGDIVNTFREKVNNCLDYGATYYPWLNTSIVQENDLSFLNTNRNADYFKDQFIEELKQRKPEKPFDETEMLKELDVDDATLHKILLKSSALYAEVMKEMRLMLNLLPPSAAMAGIYTMVDNTKGVWKAPANVGVAACMSPAVNISNEEQEDLNVPLSGKAVNAIRFFVGQGIRVWGARTLDGNSLDWRYINVRRTMIMLEESIKNATKAYVFDPNTANTWVNIKNMINNFLNGIWKRGGLAGAIPDDAFSIHVGLGETMTPEDILEGTLRVTVLVALVRPAEFIEITFQQQMQKS